MIGRVKTYMIQKLIRLIRKVVESEMDTISTKYEQQKINGIISSIEKFGKGSRLNGAIKIVFPENLVIEDNVHIGDNAFLNCRGGVTIGANTHIARNVTIYSANHNYEGTCLPYDNTHVLKPVVIERNVWIGANVTIVPGVNIGVGAIVGAGTVVNRNVPPFSIVAAGKFAIIKYRNREHYEELERMRKYGGVDGEPYES